MDANFNREFIIRITLVSALGGLLFGYDWVVIGGAKPFYERYFDIVNSPVHQGFAMSSALLGCLFGALFTGYLSDRYGRVLLLKFSALLFAISAIGTGIVDSYNPFIIYRILGGLAIGIASATSPLYIAEISPSQIRGRLVSVNQLTIVIGILSAQIVNFFIAEHVPAGTTDEVIKLSWNGQMGWRWMFWAEAIPAFTFLLLTFSIPESPRFLIRLGKVEASYKVLEKIGGSEHAKFEVSRIYESLNGLVKGKVDWQTLYNKKFRPFLILGIVLAAYQQWCGINVIFNYADEVFISAGYSVSEMLLNVVITGSVNLVFTLVAMRIVDSLGRRKMMLIGSSGLAIIYTILGFSYYLELQGIIILSLVVISIAIYAFTLAPVTWVILSEIFPNRIRGVAMAIATTSLWLASFGLTYTFPILNKALGAAGTFWIYAIISIVGYLFIFKSLPETKGKSLEEIENLYS